MTRAGRIRAGLAGMAAAAVALGVAEVVAVFTGARSAPLVAVGSVVVDSAPEWLKRLGIALFGVHDKIALLVGTAVLLAGFAALIGLLAARNRAYGVAGIAMFGLIGVVAAVTRPGAGALAALPSVCGSAAAVPVLRLLVDRAVPAAGPTADRAGSDRPADERRPAEDRGATRVQRRGFLQAVAVAGGAAAAAGVAGRWLTTRRSVAAARAAVRLPTPVAAAPAVPATADLRVTGLAAYVTANRDFYRIDTALVAPQLDPADWRLRVHGRVRNPFELSFAELLARPMVERYVTLACVSNEVGGDLVGNARWLGVPIAELLAEAEPLDGADQVVGRSIDGWTCGSPTALLRDGRDALIAVGMNGQPLPVEHGFPARMVVPGLYGYVSACKWVVELELSSFADFDAYWVPRGWSARAPVKTQSRIDTPRAGGRVTAGPVTVAGVAWAPHRGIAGVEVRVDDGPWEPASLAGTVSPDTWRQWSWRWQAPTGSHRLQVRATDATGATQPGERTDVVPDGATGWHTVRIEVA